MHAKANVKGLRDISVRFGKTVFLEMTHSFVIAAEAAIQGVPTTT